MTPPVLPGGHPAEADHPATVPAAVLRRAEEDPDRPALTDRHGTMTYGRLVTAARELAAVLRSRLAGAEPVVAVLQPRTSAAPVAQFATWLAGAAFLPLDPALPAARIAQVLAEADCRLAVAADDLADRLPPELTVVRSRATEPGGELLTPPDDPTRLAYLVSTSGSTGRPRQVEVEHGSLRAVLDWYGEFFRLGPGVRTAAFAGLAFDASLLDLWAPLSHGATVLLADETVLREPERIVDVLRRADHAFLATPLAEQLLRADPPTGRLRSLATGGDRLRVWPPADFGAAVHNLYGPTEATILVTATDDLRRHVERTGPPPIGRPVAGARLSLAPVDGGDELLVAGPLLARGYRNAPESTAAVFRSTPGGRHYRTGDLCRSDDTGQLHFVGRSDGQVKIRGNRIELREVEFALLAVPGVTQAVADVLDRAGEAVLAAWVVGPVDADAVRAGLRERLPASMVPHLVEVRPELPLTVNGKLDRRALRDSATDDVPTAPQAEDGTFASTVAAAWQAVLGRAAEPDDDFFGAGGDSLLAARFSAEVRRGSGLDVRAALLYEHRRFADYLRAVEALDPDRMGATR
ncbi:non-ribosomal peptide synthetase [Micromonospora aurantiaca]|uniref:non-ribosomal peptide synthetase n=1 Tax=Micromonospora aurantiaca (nom. illeg.) TaxID=47850 RepID=UPI0033BFA171